MLCLVFYDITSAALYLKGQLDRGAAMRLNKEQRSNIAVAAFGVICMIGLYFAVFADDKSWRRLTENSQLMATEMTLFTIMCAIVIHFLIRTYRKRDKPQG